MVKFFSSLFLALALALSPCYGQVDGVREVFVRADNAQLFCKVIGKGDPIVVIHGGPGLSLDYLFPQMARLAKTHLVIFYDQRACGRSTGEINSNSMQIAPFLDDLECLRKSFGFKKMTVLGHSWGGFLAMKYAIAHPGSVDRLILLNTMPPSSEDLSLFLEEYVRRTSPYQEDLKAIKETQGFINGDPLTIARYYQTIFRTYCYRPEKSDLLNLRMNPNASLNGFKVHEALCQNTLLRSFNLYDLLKHLKMPTLIIHGESDPIPHITAQKIHEHIPHSKYILLKECGHFPYVEAPDLFFEHLNTFLKR
jgi:proline iminopeptidase